MSTPREVYLLAAELVAEGLEDFSCCAISKAAGLLGGGRYKYEAPERRAYSTLYRDGSETNLQYAIEWQDEIERRDLRVMLLLFAAEILG